ncbi:hypothetical protein M885DRAFT_610350 [Pelagophyceae sp. CCMP2097]|nr:hypothetical protein M885DRAFT_610350 [Pelagophyceae sp. CCMP2097]
MSGRRGQQPVSYAEPGQLTLSEIRGRKKTPTASAKKKPSAEKTPTAKKTPASKSKKKSNDDDDDYDAKKKRAKPSCDDDAASGDRGERASSKKKRTKPSRDEDAASGERVERASSKRTKPSRDEDAPTASSDGAARDDERASSRDKASSSRASHTVKIVRDPPRETAVTSSSSERSRRASAERGVSAAAADRATLARADAAFWRGKFDALAALRETAAEAALGRALSHNACLVKLVGTASNASLDAAVSDAPAAAAPEADWRRDVVGLRRVVRAYRLMTGIQVLNVIDAEEGSDDDADDDSLEVDCVASSDLSCRQVRFSLAVGGCDVSFTPTRGQESLPEYLRGEIEFDAEQCPVLMSRILGIIHKPREAE